MNTQAKAFTSKLTNQEIKEQLFLLAQVNHSDPRFHVRLWLLDELESRLCDDDFDYFLEQLEIQEIKTAA